MKLLPLIITLLNFFIGPRAEAQSYCEPAPVRVVKRYSVPGEVSYYYKVSVNQNEIFYADTYSSKEQVGSKVLNLKTSQRQRLRGYVDPTPLLADNLVLIMGAKKPELAPKGSDVEYDLTMQILTRDQALQNTSAKALWTDPNAERRAYPSAGYLERNGRKFHRILLANDKVGGLELIEFSFQNGGIQNLRRGPVCQNIKSALPVIAKNGQELAAYHQSTMKVFALPEDPFTTKNCEIKEDLGLPTGKVDFSYDGGQIAFHASVVSSDEEKWTESKPASTVYIYDRTMRTRRMIADTRGSSFSFPMFTKSGQLFLHEDTPKGQAFVLIDPNKSGLQTSPTHSRDGNDSMAWALIGSLRLAACDHLSRVETSVATRLAKEMNTGQCHQLVDDYWEELSSLLILAPTPTKKNEIALITALGASLGQKIKYEKSRLYAACDLLIAVQNQNLPEPASEPHKEENQINAIFNRRCNYCHVDQSKIEESKSQYSIQSALKTWDIISGNDALSQSHKKLKLTADETQIIKNIVGSQIDNIRKERQQKKSKLQALARASKDFCEAAKKANLVDDENLEDIPVKKQQAYCRQRIESKINALSPESERSMKPFDDL